MVKLFGFGPNFGLPDPSPFVLKASTFMKMTGIEFELIADFSNFKNAPKGKLPFIEDKGVIIADSFFILEHLKNRYQTTLDQHLSEREKALSHLIIKSLDENFYWCIVYSRWFRYDTWPHIKNAFFGDLPLPLRYIVPAIVKRGTYSAFRKQGMGKHSDEEIMRIAHNTLESLSIILADKPYLFGDKPSTLDAVAYASLAQLILSSLDNPLNQLARSFANLTPYCERIRGQYYAEAIS